MIKKNTVKTRQRTRFTLIVRVLGIFRLEFFTSDGLEYARTIELAQKAHFCVTIHSLLLMLCFIWRTYFLLQLDQSISRHLLFEVYENRCDNNSTNKKNK